MEPIAKEVVIVNRLGLHARAASLFVRLATQYPCEVFVSKDGQKVNGKSIMGVLMLVASQGTTICISCEGAKSVQALDELEKLVASGFGEDE